ncbi:DNA-binding protein [Arachidicoccus ginsenosidimutans]|uniref:DUF3276 family protein n=1 Tax=Arachidicoccus sp. BS20 TaxID=1850526 RepID=UPI0007F129F9|nr:DUF3276 family protein [Arachidicoccus sp. BS20]ANI90718.1 DNA-binding protein [Arachidicoccus sp. BS20]
MDYEQNERKQDSVYSKRLKAGKRRTYFFDVRATKGSDYYLVITESRKRFNEDGYDRHKIFLYKEDFNKFVKGLSEAVDYIKTELMPDYDFDAFNHDENFISGNDNTNTEIPAESNIVSQEEKSVPNEETKNTAAAPDAKLASEEVDKW